MYLAREERNKSLLLGLAVGGTRLVSLVALVRHLLHSPLAGDNLLHGGEDAAPVLEDGEGHALAGAVGDEI